MTKLESITSLKKYGIKDVSRIYVKTETVAKSGMSRTVSVFIPVQDRLNGLDIICINYLTSEITGQKLDKNGNIKLHGCGMDMHYWLVSELAREMGLTLEKVTL